VGERNPVILVWEDPRALAKLPLPLPLLFYIPLTPPPPSPPFLAPPLGILPLDLLIYYCSTHHHQHHHYHHNNNNNPTNLALLPSTPLSSFLGHKVLVLHRLTPMSTHKPVCKALALMIAFVPEITSAAPVQ